MNNNKTNFAFFGTGPLAESVLAALYRNDFVPSLIITTEDKKAGRNLELQKNHIKIWSEIKNIKCLQPKTLRDLNEKEIKNIFEDDFDFFIVASYPKILPKNILDLAKLGSLNVHPSMLPKYRGPSPIQTALLNGDAISGISIIKLDEEVDHGPILIQKEFNIKPDDTFSTLEVYCGIEGGEMLASILPSYLDGSLKLKDQDHKVATFTKKFEKSFGEIDIKNTSAIELQNKFRALTPHIPIYFFIKKQSPPQPSPKGEVETQNANKLLRVKITEINFDKDFAVGKTAKDIIKKLIPENKSEMSLEDFERGYLK